MPVWSCPTWEGSSMSSAKLVREAQRMPQEEPGCGDPLGPLAAMREIVPFEADATSDRLGWTVLEAARYRAAPTSDVDSPALTHHWLVLVDRPPEELVLRYEGVERHVPLPAGSISLVPA